MSSFFVLLENVGLLRGDYKNEFFVKSKFKTFKSYFILFIFISYLLKNIVALFLQDSVKSQVYLGNFFFYANIASFWTLLFFFFATLFIIVMIVTVNYLHNFKKSQKYMKIIVMSINENTNFKTVGFPERLNKHFWMKQFKIVNIIQNFNIIFYFFLVPIVVLKFHLELQKFGLQENFITIANHIHFFIFTFFSVSHYLSFPLIFFSVCLFFNKKLIYLNAQLKKQQFSKRFLRNKKIQKLIFELNFVKLELLEVNFFYKNVHTINFIFGFIFTVIFSFFATFLTSVLKQLFLLSIFYNHFYSIILQYFLSNMVSNSVKLF